jgi:hypothetical protein
LDGSIEPVEAAGTTLVLPPLPPDERVEPVPVEELPVPDEPLWVFVPELPLPVVPLVAVPVAVPVEEGVVLPPAGMVPSGVDDAVPVPEPEPAAVGPVGAAADVPSVLEDGGAVKVTGEPAGPAGSVRLVGVPGP